MKRSKLFSLPLILIVLLSFTVGLSSCTTTKKNRTPQEIIQDEFGNKEFKISFSSETLDKPLADVSYSANKIPLLPTPQKVGYIFEGWFLDPEFIVPYTDDTLLLHMSDITLYPKWSKERFNHNGTYDIKFEGRIIPESIKKGSTTDKYGGYRSFVDQINVDNTHIEKDDNNLILKLEYDCIATTPFQAKGEVFKITPNSSMNSDIRIVNKIDSLADSVKTLFINVNSWDFSKPLLLDVLWTNFESKELNEDTRYETTTRYTVELSLTEIVGFDQPFVDTSVPLEKGYYLAKSYYRKEDNGESMGSIYNPVYSYLYSDGKENYKLIKQNSPYLGLVALEHPLYTPITQNYFERMMAFTSLTTVFDINSRGSEGLITSDFYPETYQGGYYRETVTEFHSDTGKFYNIIDIDKDLSKEYLALTAISGYMERESGMGYIRQILSIDYKNLIKISECDYQPLEGDSFEYEDKFAFYPGNYNDIDQNNLTYPAMLEYGISFDMPNFYYSAKEKNSPYKERTIYSSKVTTTPSAKTSVMKVSESRGILGEFNTHAEIFGYEDGKGENLYLDRMAPQMFEGESYNNQLRYVRDIKNGMTVNVGDKLMVSRIFNEKVNRNVNFSKVEYKAYEMNDYQIDFNKPYEITNEFEFKRDIAIEFKYVDYLGYEKKTIVEIRLKDEPILKTKDNLAWSYNPKTHHYTTTSINEAGSNISYPELTYSYGRCKDVKLVDDFYDQMDGKSINPSKAYMYALHDGYKKLYLPTALTTEIEIPSQNMYLVYEINNEYNEKEFIYYDYISNPKPSYTINNQDGDLIFKDYVKYDTKTGERLPSYYKLTLDPYYDKFKPNYIMDYTFSEDGAVNDFNLFSFYIYSNNGNLEKQYYKSKEDAAKRINEFLKDKSYALITFEYNYANEWLDVSIPYNLTFNGIDSYEALNYEAYFTNTTYSFSKTNLIGNRENIAKVSTSLDKIVDGMVSKNQFDVSDYKIDSSESQITFSFKTPGLYRLKTTYYVPKYILGELTSGHSTELTFYQYFDVISDTGEVKITYITDDLHPFRGGETKKEVTYNLAEGITLSGDGKDMFIRNDFDPLRRDDVLLKWNTRNDANGDNYSKNAFIRTDDFISDYNTDNLVLYAVWDLKYKFTFVIDEDTTKVVEATMDSNNNYVVEFPDKPTQSAKYKPKFVNWVGECLPRRDYSDEYHFVLPYRDDYYKKPESFFTIYAEYQNQYLMKFDVDKDKAYIVRGGYVGEGDLVDNIEDKMNPRMKDENYVFEGWYLATDTEYKHRIDLNTFRAGDEYVTRVLGSGEAWIELKARFVLK